MTDGSRGGRQTDIAALENEIAMMSMSKHDNIVEYMESYMWEKQATPARRRGEWASRAAMKMAVGREVGRARGRGLAVAAARRSSVRRRGPLDDWAGRARGGAERSEGLGGLEGLQVSHGRCCMQ